MERKPPGKAVVHILLLGIKQWGSQPGAVNSVGFPIAFSSKVASFMRLPLRDSATASVYQDFCYSTLSSSGFTSTTLETTLNHIWVAIGY